MPSYADSASFILSGPERPVLVLALHGLTGDSRQTMDLFAGLNAPGFGILAPDLRGHGGTDFQGEPEDFTPAVLAEDVVALLQHLGLSGKTLQLVGVSLGATVALELMRYSPLTIERAVFLRPAHDADTPRNLAVNLVIASLLRDHPSDALERLLRTDEYRLVANVSKAAAAGLRAKVTKPCSIERVARLERGSVWRAFAHDDDVVDAPPTLIVAAPADPLHPVSVAQSWQRRIRGSTLAMLPARDVDPTAQSREIARLVGSFLSVTPLAERASL